MKAQLYDWLYQPDKIRVGEYYTFSFWTYSKCGGQLTVLQNAKIIGTIQIPHSDVLSWHRQKVTFKLQDVDNEDVMLSVVVTFTPLSGNEADSAEKRILYLQHHS